MPVASALIGAGGSVAGNVANLFSQYSSQRYNTAEAEKTRNHDREMFDKTNQYNDPSNQVQRLRDAGLNPNLMYGMPASSGQATATNTGSQAQTTAKQYNFDGIANAQILANQTKVAEAQSNNLDADTAVKKSEIPVKETQADKNSSESAFTKLQTQIQQDLYDKGVNDLLLQKYQTEIDQSLSTIKNLDEKTLQLTLENLFNDATLDDRIKQVSADLSLTKAHESEVHAHIKKFLSDIRRNEFQNTESSANTRNTHADTRTKNAQTSNITTTTMLNDLTYFLKTTTMPAQVLKEFTSSLGGLLGGVGATLVK